MLRSTLKFFSLVVAVFAFSTGLNAQTLLIDEDLRSGNLPLSWSQTDVSFSTAAGGYANITGTTGVLTVFPFDASTFGSVEVNFDVAKFGSGTDGPITVEYTLDGTNWQTAGDSPTPTSSTYLSSTITIFSVSASMQVRFTAASSPSNKRLRDVVINGLSAGAAPEPSNHATSFNCSAQGSGTIDLTWVDATGAQLPAGYLIRWSDVDYASITAPTDGTPVADGANALNVLQGVQSASITGLNASTTYYFRIFPYTNSGVDIDYKTDSTIPETDCTTAAPAWEDFETGSKGSYGSGTVTCTAGTWLMNDALIGSLGSDRKNGTSSVRMRNSGVVEMQFDLTNGLGTVDIEHAVFGSEGNSTWRLEVSDDGGSTWNAFVSPSVTTSSTSLTTASFTVNIPGTVRFRVQKLIGSERINIDDIYVTDYVAPATITTGAVSASVFTLSDCNTTASGTVAFTTTGAFGGGNVFTAELSDENGVFTNALSIGSGTTSPVNITIPENLPSGTGYLVRVVSSDPAVTGSQSSAIEIIQNGSDCPELGDFRTRASGIWTATNVWQSYVYNPSSQLWEWQDVTGHPDSDAVSVFVMNGDTIAHTSGPKLVNNLTVESGAKLFRDNGGCNLQYISLGGDIFCNGQIGNGTTADAIGFNVLTGTHTISGSGEFDAYRIRLSNDGTVGQLGNATLNIEMDINLRWDPNFCGGIGSGSHAIYNNLADVGSFDVVIAAGHTLSLTNSDAALGIDGAYTGTYANTERSGGYQVFGTIECAGAINLGSDNTLSGPGSVYLDIENGGLVTTDYLLYGTDNAADGGELAIAAGGTLRINGVGSGEDAWLQTTAGSIVYTMNDEGTVEYARNGNQNVPALFTYGSLEFSGTGTKTLTDLNTTVTGGFTVNSGATVQGNDPTFALNVGGDWTNDGTFNAGDGTVIFDGAAAQTIGGASTTRFENITMDSGNNLTLLSNTEVHGVFAPESGSFDAGTDTLILVSDASGTGSIGEIKSGASYTGSTTMQRFIPAGVQNWVNLGNALTGATVADWNDDVVTTGFPGSDFPTYTNQNTGQLFNNILGYDETVQDSLNEGFVGVTALTDNLSTERGYFVYMLGTAQNIDVTGSIQQGSLTTALDYTDSPLGASEDGWELVTNRYPSEISFDSLYNASTNIGATYYVYNADNGSYDTYTSGVGGTASGFIPSSQSFWVQSVASGAQLQFEERFKTNNGTNFERSFDNIAAVTLQIRNGDYSQVTTLVSQEGYSLDMDLGYDAFHLGSMTADAPQIAFVATGGEKTTVNRFTPEDGMSVPVYISVPAGTHEIEVLDSDIFDGTTCYSIEDLITGELFPLDEGTIISLTTEEEFTGARYMLHIAAPLKAPDMNPATCATSTDGSISAECVAANGNVEILDLDGNVIASQEAIEGVLIFNNLPEGDYMIRYNSEDLTCGFVQYEIYLEAMPSMQAETTVVPAFCNEAGTGVITVSVNDQPATIDLIQDGQIILTELIESELSVAGLDAGSYEVEISNACVTYTEYLELGDPSAITAELNIPQTALLQDAQAVAMFSVDVTDNVTVNWFVSDAFIGSGVSITHLFNAAGDYDVRAEMANENCELTLEGSVTVSSAVGVNEDVSDKLTIATTQAGWNLSGAPVQEAVFIELFDLKGSLINQIATNGATGMIEIPSADLAPGIYMVRLFGSSGVITTDRVIR